MLKNHLFMTKRKSTAPATRLRWLQALLILCLVSSSCFGPPVSARANGLEGAVSKVVPFAGFLVGLHHRNRVYRQSNNFIGERRAYYDKLRETARQQLLNRELSGIRRSQVAAYIKVVALIEQERQTEFQVAEGRKQQARRAFHERVEDTVFFAISGSRLAQELFNAMKNGLGSVDQLLVRAVDAVSGGGSALDDLARIRQYANRISTVSLAIGGPVGVELSEASQRLIKAIDRPQAELLGGLQNARAEIQGLNSFVDNLSRIGRAPSAGAVGQEVASRFLPTGGSQDVSLEAISMILSQLKTGDGSLKDEARSAIRAGFAARCALISQAYRAQVAALNAANDQTETSQTECNPIVSLNRSSGEADAAQSTPEGPANPTESQPAEEPTEEAPEPPIVTASGVISEMVTAEDPEFSKPYGTQFTLTANFSTGSISGSLIGARNIPNLEEQCVDTNNNNSLLDTRVLAIEDTYTADFNGALAADGSFSISISPRNLLSEKVSQPYTSEYCLHLNSEDSLSVDGEGTIIGNIQEDGSVQFSTHWHGSIGHVQGSWSGSGEVKLP